MSETDQSEFSGSEDFIHLPLCNEEKEKKT